MLAKWPVQSVVDLTRVVIKAVPQDQDTLMHSARTDLPSVDLGRVQKRLQKLKRVSTLEIDAFQSLRQMSSTRFQVGEGIRIRIWLHIDEVMAFGDSDNDLEMLCGVGLSIVMGKWNDQCQGDCCYAND